MILSAGLSPAWQQILVFDRLQTGEVNRAREAAWCASGKVVNVGLALSRLGASCRLLSLVGGPAGTQLRGELEQFGVDCRWVESLAPTRICTTILDRKSGQTTELVENARSPSERELSEFENAFAEEAAKAGLVVLTGSLPPSAPRTFYRDLLEGVACPAVLDVRGPELLAALERRPLVVKPNREELAQTYGRHLATDADLLAAMRETNRRGAAWVVVSQGKDAVWMTGAAGREVYRLQPPAARVVNPIGCGDCLAAGIAWGLSRDNPPLEAIRLGMAAAAENLEQLLPGRLDAEAVVRRARTVDLTYVESGGG